MFRLAYNMTEDSKFQNWSSIHPLMQLETFNLINFLVSRGLTKLIVFGSSTTRFCHVWSDLDIYVEGCTRTDVEDYEPKRQIEIDLVPVGTSLSSPIGKQIEKTGVVVFG